MNLDTSGGDRWRPWAYGVGLALGVVVLVQFATFGVSSSPPPEPEPVASAAPVEQSPPAPRFDAAALDRAREEIEKEPQVIDFILDPSLTVELQIAVKNDGTKRYGFAGYFCLMLRQWKIYDRDMDVRLVDAARVDESGGDFRSISLGWVHCDGEVRMD